MTTTNATYQRFIDSAAAGDLHALQRQFAIHRWHQHELVRAVACDDTALHLAALYGHLHVVRWLVTQAGAPINVQGSVSSRKAVCNNDTLISYIV
jgi:hypothetical protein